MPSLIEGENRQMVKRAVPKSSNKIHAAGIARLYIAYPDRQRWTYTGLQGAIVLANDTVGNTFWLKLVDISSTNRGVIWDQEIYDTIQYNQDRVFFHTFELEQCLAGLSFVDDKEAKQFKKKMDEREKNAHKNTKAKAFGAYMGRPEENAHTSGKSHGLLGRFIGHRHTSAPQYPQAQSMIPPPQVSYAPSLSPPSTSRSSGDILANIDPSLLAELKALGLSESQLAENADFIKTYVSQRQSTSDLEDHRSKAPPPPPPAQPLTPQDTGDASSGRRAPPPAPPPARRAGEARPPSPPVDSETQSSSPQAPVHSTFRVPVFESAGKFAKDLGPAVPARKPVESSPNPAAGPPPPPRPPKTPLDEDKSIFGVPPPFTGERKPAPSSSRGPVPPPPPARNSGPPPPPARNSGPPPPPARDSGNAHAVPPATIPPPPLPPKTPVAPVYERQVPPPPPARGGGRSVPPPPPAPARTNAAPTAPPPPPMPTSSGPPPPPPPMPSSGGPPPPPPPPPGGAPDMAPVTANAPPLPQAGDRGGLLADIRGGAKLKKVSEKDKSDRSAVQVGGGSGGGGGGGGGAGGAAPPAAEGGLAGALANALAQRKAKVSTSDDEDDKDDW